MPKPPRQILGPGGEPSESPIDGTVAEFFQMRAMFGLNPNVPENIPRYIIGGFIANLRGFSLLSDFLDEEAAGDAEKRMYGETLGELRAEDNLLRISEIVGNAVLSVTEINPDSEAIRLFGVYPVTSAVGDLDPYSHPGRTKTTLGGDTGRRQDVMRLTGSHRNEFYLIDVIGEDYEPLVDIQVVEQPKPSLRTAARQFVGWLKG